jgi:hypothetical protein
MPSSGVNFETVKPFQKKRRKKKKKKRKKKKT